MRVAIYTLGCKVNQYETQAMEQELLRRGIAGGRFDVAVGIGRSGEGRSYRVEELVCGDGQARR